jgi:pimeloyl-ACP methyl ester carboxylesterase
MPYFKHGEHRLAYTIHGPADSPRTTILLHGLLLSQKMHLPLAKTLAKRGDRVITLDLLGHGRSDRPRDMWRYSMTFFGEQVVGLMDHLEIDQAVVAGTSLGANASLEVASLAPARLRGMVIEMPVLDNALLGVSLTFVPLWVATTFGEPVARPLAQLVSRVPRGRVPFWADVILDLLGQEPGPTAAIIQGLFFGRVAPHRIAAVSDHQRRDPVHPFSDAGMLADELPNGRLIEADSLFELRMAPERLTGEIAAFIDECWRPKRAKPAPAAAAG